MRYRFIDEVVSIDLGERPSIEITKIFQRGDDVFSGAGGHDRVPSSLILELLAMAGGHLLFRHLGERRLPLLLKIAECRFGGVGRPGVRLRARAELRAMSPHGVETMLAETSGEVSADGECLATGRLLYVCVALPGVDLHVYQS